MKNRFPPRRLFISLCLVALAGFTVFVPAPTSGQSQSRVREDVDKVLSSYDQLSLDPPSVLRQVRETSRLSLGTSQGTFVLDLEPHDLRAPHYRSEAWGGGGSVRQLGREPVRTFKGTVRGMKGAQARFTIDEQTVEGLIITPAGLYFVEPTKNLSPSAGAKDFVFYAESSVTRDSPGECGVTLAEEVGERAAGVGRGEGVLNSKGASAEEIFGPARDIEITTEADFEFFQSFSAFPDPAQATNNEILSIMSQVEGIYNTQLGLQFSIVFQRVWTTNTDPYTLTASGAALQQFTDLYNGSFAPGSPPARDIAHMWTGKDFDGSTIGIAWRPGFDCPATNFGYGISQRINGDAEKIGLTAHEIGHNFSATHTSAASGTDCGGTIMNPSITSSLEFCQFSKDEMTAHAIDNKECLTLLAPAGCTYALSPSTQQVANTGGAGSASVIAPAGCPWAVAEVAPPWITFTGDAGVGTGTVSFTLAANTGGPREALADVAGQKLTVTQAASPACPQTPIADGNTAGTLAATDCRSGQTGRVDAFIDLYTFSGVAGQRVRIEMNASVTPNAGGTGLDTFLYLFGPDGTVVAENDDIVLGQATNSRIPVASNAFFTLPQTGTYIVEATSFDDVSNDAGAYTLALTTSGSPFNHVSVAGGGSLSVAEGVGGDGIGIEGLGFRTVTVSRAVTAGAASVNYATSNGTATSTGDYTAALGTLSFAAGEVSKSFVVLVSDDAFDESDETVNITLSNPVGIDLAPGASTALLTIADNDAANGPSPVREQSFNTRFFVRQHYLDFLGREPDLGGLNFWSNGIESCGANEQCRAVKRVDTSAAFFLSIEFQETGYLVQRMYKVAFGDAAGQATVGGVPVQIAVPVVRFNEFLADTQRIAKDVIVGTPGWPERLAANKAAFAQEFVSRTRFTNEFLPVSSPGPFVDRLNSNSGGVLSQAERDALVAELTANNTAAGRASVVVKVAEDPDLVAAEKNKAFVLMQYMGYLRRNPNDPPDADHSGYNFWLGKLNQFNGDFRAAQMVFAFIDSIEYKQRFGQP